MAKHTYRYTWQLTIKTKINDGIKEYYQSQLVDILLWQPPTINFQRNMMQVRRESKITYYFDYVLLSSRTKHILSVLATAIHYTNLFTTKYQSFNEFVSTIMITKSSFYLRDKV